MRLLGALIAGLLFGMLTGTWTEAQPAWKVSRTLHIGGEGGWDYVTVDPGSHRLFVTRTTHTMIVDADSGKILGDVPARRSRTASPLCPD